MNAPFIREVSWTHGSTVTPAVAAETLKVLTIRLSLALHTNTIQQLPQVVQVWWEPREPPAGATVQGSLLPMLSLPGTLKMVPLQLNWTGALTGTPLTQVLNTGGRVLVRIHCGVLLSTDKRIYSASLLAIGFDTPRLPGGVFESWFFVSR
jgi:hypothetical protein